MFSHSLFSLYFCLSANPVLEESQVIQQYFILITKSWSLLKKREKEQGPVVQSIINLTNSLRDQLVKCFTPLYPNTFTFLLKK